MVLVHTLLMAYVGAVQHISFSSELPTNWHLNVEARLVLNFISMATLKL